MLIYLPFARIAERQAIERGQAGVT
jgi:hypothetical protein